MKKLLWLLIVVLLILFLSKVGFWAMVWAFLLGIFSFFFALMIVVFLGILFVLGGVWMFLWQLKNSQR